MKKFILCANKRSEQLILRIPRDKMVPELRPSAILPMRNCVMRVSSKPPPVINPTCVYDKLKSVRKTGKRMEMTATDPSLTA